MSRSDVVTGFLMAAAFALMVGVVVKWAVVQPEPTPDPVTDVASPADPLSLDPSDAIDQVDKGLNELMSK